MTYTAQDAIYAIKPTYIMVYISLQLGNIALLTYFETSPLVFAYAVSLVAMRYTMVKLTSKYGQNSKIGFNIEFTKIIALTNLGVTIMMYIASEFMLSIPNLVGIFFFLMLFSYVGVFLEQWYEFVKSKKKRRK